MAVASIHDLTVQYGHRVALSNVRFDIPGGCVGLLGPNGAGKSTLIKTLLGFLTPASGRAEVLGVDVATDPLAVRRMVGLMPEQECHIPGMNAVTFVSYAGELSGMPSGQALRRAHEVLEYVGLGEARYRNVETYSTGMKQRIKLAQALVHGPQLVFLDEPTNGLDPQGRDEMLTLISDVSTRVGVNMVVSSHLLPDIERVCAHVVVLRSGEVAAEGALTDLRSEQSARMLVEIREAHAGYADTLSRMGVQVLRCEGARLVVSACGEPDICVRTVLEAAAACGAQVRSVRMARRTLEEVFMEALA